MKLITLRRTYTVYRATDMGKEEKTKALPDCRREAGTELVGEGRKGNRDLKIYVYIAVDKWKLGLLTRFKP